MQPTESQVNGIILAGWWNGAHFSQTIYDLEQIGVKSSKESILLIWTRLDEEVDFADRTSEGE